MATKKTDSAGGIEGGAGSKTGSASKTASAQKSAPAAAKGASAQKSATKSAPKSASKSAQKSAPAKRAGGLDLRSEARGFVAGRPQGWNHDEWLSFLDDLRQRGHNVEDRDAIGSLLERERLGVVLERVEGISAQRVRAIADRYGNVWRLKDASPEELAREAKIPQPLAERILESVR